MEIRFYRNHYVFLKQSALTPSTFMPISAGIAGAATATLLPDRTIELLTKHKLGLFGAITSKPNKAAQAELKPELQGKGYVYYSPIVTMRQKFNLDICMRPCVGFNGNPLNYIRKKTDGGFDEPHIDTTVFRQGTEGMYAGVEWTNPPENVRAALEFAIPASRPSPMSPALNWPSVAASSPAMRRSALCRPRLNMRRSADSRV